MEAQEASIRAGLTYVNIHSNTFPGGEIRGQIVPDCSDGNLDPGEQCDDGNLVNGDCCDESCQFEPAASACTASVCETGTCDGVGSCVFAIRNDCVTSLKSFLLVKNDADNDGKDKLIWKFINKGPGLSSANFGTPTATTNYTLCVYAGTTAVIAADVAASPTLWSLATSGFVYKDSFGSSDGVQKVILRPGADGQSKILFKGKGGNLPDPPAGPFALPVTAHLINSEGDCFGGAFDSNDVIKNEPELFKAKATP